MSRADTTAELSGLARRKLSRLTPWWASEVPVDGGAAGSGVVDFMAYRPRTSGHPAGSDGEVELGTFYFVEVKSCMADFESGHGLNFHGDVNWLVCERDLADRLREEGRVPFGCKVYVPDKPRRRLIKYIENDWERPVREHGAAFLLFQMMRRMRFQAYGEPVAGFDGSEEE